MNPLELWPVVGLGEIVPGSDLAAAISAAVEASGDRLVDGDIVVITQKVVSKAEGCLVDLATVEPSVLALDWAQRWAKDARVVELVLRESRRIVRMERGVIISETRHGLICANAGVDVSNVGSDQATREGQTNIAIGVSGVEALRHFEGQVDPTGYELRVTMLATADELAGAAELVMGKVDGVPVAIVRGLARALAEGSASELIRPAAADLFR